MNFGQLKTRAAQLAALNGWDDVQPQPDWASLVNRALYLFSWNAEYASGTYTFTTIANQAEYNLPTPSDWVRVTDVARGNTASLELTDENILRRENDLWHVAPAATPDRYYISSPNTIRLYPTPAASGMTISLRGIRTDNALSADADLPDCPEPFHEGIALLAAWLHCKTFAQGDDLAKVEAYHTEAFAYAEDCKLYLAQQSTPVLQRFVRRSAPERLSLGWFRYPSY